MNKQIAADLDLSVTTVKLHRGQIMRKMQAKSLPQLVRFADRLGVSTSLDKQAPLPVVDRHDGAPVHHIGWDCNQGARTCGATPTSR
jgi:hypothetical protein